MSTEKETSITEEYFRQRSQQLGWKFTNQRYSIYRCMVGNKNHPTADEVKKMLEKEYPNISRDSVFRILNDFVSVGLIGKLEFSSPIRFDGNSSWPLSMSPMQKYYRFFNPGQRKRII